MNAKTTVVGKQIVDFVTQENGERVQGVNLFLVQPDENVQGLKAVKLWIDGKSKAYSDALVVDVSEPCVCEFIYQYTVGQKKPQLVGIKAV